MKCINCGKKINAYKITLSKYRNQYCGTCKKIKTIQFVEMGVRWHALFYYERDAKNLVIKSKKSSSSIFCNYIKNSDFFNMYKKWLWIPAPSKNSHLNKTLNKLNVRYEECFEKCSNTSQKNNSLEQRLAIKLNLLQYPSQKNIIIFDDLVSSGATIREMISHLHYEYNIVVLTFCLNRTI